MQKTLRKELWREIHSSRNRFLSIFLMVALGVMFLVGLRSAAPDMRTTADGYFDAAGFYDIQVLSTLGLTEADIDAFSQAPGVEEARGGFSVDAALTLDDAQKNIKALDLSETFDRPELLAGRMPEKPDECLLDEKLQTLLELEVGDTVTLTPGKSMEDALAEETFTITGIAHSPLYISLDRGTGSLGDGSVSGFVLLPRESFSLDTYTLCSIHAAGAAELDAYGTAYQRKIETLTEELETVARQRADLRYETLRADAQTDIDQGTAELEQAEADADAELQKAQDALDDARKELDESRAALELAAAYGGYSQEELEAAQAKIDAGETEYQQGRSELEEARVSAAAEIEQGKQQLSQAEEQLSQLKPADVYVLDRNSNYGFVSYDQNATRMDNLANMFPVIFFVVAALVCLTTMTRMVEEERTQIGAIKAMGYGTGAITWKFLIYGMLAAVGGTLVGAVIGTTLIPWVIFTSYGIMYVLPELQISVHWGLCLGAGAAGLVCTVGATLWAMLATARQTPAALMRPKAPKAGKRIFLERIGPLWRRMSFSMKVSARNLLRYKKRFFMTVIGVAGCTALLIAGLGLRSSLFRIIDVQYGDIYRYDVQASLEEGSAADVSAKLGLQSAVQVDSAAQVFTRSVSFSSDAGSLDGYLMVTDDPAALAEEIDLRTMKGQEPLALPETGVIIGEKLAELLEVQVGDDITLDCGTPVQVQVAGITEHYIYHYAYMDAGYYETLLGTAYEPNELLISIRDGDRAPALCEYLLGLEGVQSASNIRTSAQSFRETMEVVDAAVTIIVLSAAALALVVLYNLTNINITERIRELATIKVLGFFDREVAMYIYRENIVLTVLGIALGQLMGKYLCRYLIRTIEMDIVMFGRDAVAKNYIVSVLLSVLFALAVNLMMYFRMKKIDMVGSLKSVE